MLASARRRLPVLEGIIDDPATATRDRIAALGLLYRHALDDDGKVRISFVRHATAAMRDAIEEKLKPFVSEADLTQFLRSLGHYWREE